MDVQRSGKGPKKRGTAAENKVCELHLKIGILARRVPLSGAIVGYPGDVLLYPFGSDGAPYVGEVKKRKHGGGFVQLERWKGNNDVLFLLRDRADPIVVLDWKLWTAMLQELRDGRANDASEFDLRLAAK